jgi:GTP pyrophosphokinase
MAQADAQHLGEIMLTQALRAEGIESLPDFTSPSEAVWDKLIRFSGNRSRTELLTDIGLGKRIASIVAKKLTKLLAEQGAKPDALLLTRERFSTKDALAHASVLIDGSENTSVRFATCCRPVPGDAIVGHLGRGEGLAIHTSSCNVAKKLHYKDSERFINVEWSDQIVRPFETGIVVTVNNGKGVLARVAGALASAEADINHVDMGDDSGAGAMDIRFVIAVHDTQQLDVALRNLRRTPLVLRAERITPSSSN